MTVSRTDRYPLDFDALEKGDRIEIEQLEQILHTNRNDRKFSLRCAGLCDRIGKELRARGSVVTVCITKGAVVICTDAEAAEYNRRRFVQHRRGMVKSHVRNMAVDQSNLDAEQRKSHEETVLFHGHLIAAMRDKARQLKLTPPRRQTPGLSGPAEATEAEEKKPQ